MKKDRVLLIHYGELGLKGQNRGVFEKQLVSNLSAKLGLPQGKVKLAGRKIVVPLPYQGRAERVVYKQVNEVFGIAWFALAWKVVPDLVKLKLAVKKVAKHVSQKETFAVRVKRANKEFPAFSPELERVLGQIIRDETRAKVNLTSPDKTLFVEINTDGCYLFWDKQSGLGGLPVGTSGKVLALVSGGIDSPVAAYLMAKRGTSVVCLHFASVSPKQVKETKIFSLFNQLKRYLLAKPQLLVLPDIYFQLAIDNSPAKYRRYSSLLFRRFMLKSALALSPKFAAQALILGDSLGQVASQTLENIALVDRGISLPIFRPLLTFDKTEIVDLAKKIGTFEESIKPYKDSCSLGAKRPIIAGNLAMITKAETEIDWEGIIKETLKDLIVY